MITSGNLLVEQFYENKCSKNNENLRANLAQTKPEVQ